ncbi:MAG: hypothetical protein ABIR91_05900, partial [Candidatus Saccharimonadales bacterium]
RERQPQGQSSTQPPRDDRQRDRPAQPRPTDDRVDDRPPYVPAAKQPQAPSATVDDTEPPRKKRTRTRRRKPAGDGDTPYVPRDRDGERPDRDTQQSERHSPQQDSPQQPNRPRIIHDSAARSGNSEPRTAERAPAAAPRRERPQSDPTELRIR